MIAASDGSFGSCEVPESSRDFLQCLFQEALQRVDPLHALSAHLPAKPKGRVLVLGAGKASARMALALESCWDVPMEGLVVTRYQHGENCQRIRIVEAAHPVPDQSGVAAATEMLALAKTARHGDLVICLVSGGGSSLLTLPAPGISLADKQQINKALLASGANIEEINCVRRHLSAIKGGRLADACGQADVLTLIVSDAPGDNPAVVASGPTLADGSTPDDALRILARAGIAPPPSVAQALRRPREVRPIEGLGARDCRVIATATDALLAAQVLAERQGWKVLNVGGAIEGEAREAGKVLGGIAHHLAHIRRSGEAPIVLLSGGETTVTLRHPTPGRGGRNAEFLLALGLCTSGIPNLCALACDTDGIDGSESNAGAIWDARSLIRSRVLGMDAADYLARHDAHSFFSALDDLVTTGPTRTNVNDFRAIALT